VLPIRVRDALALAVAGLVMLASAVVWLSREPGMGFTIVEADGRYVVGSVSPGSEADFLGVRPGAAVTEANGASFDAAVAAYAGQPDPVRALLASLGTVTVVGPSGPVALKVVLDSRVFVFRWSVIPFLLGVLVLAGGAWWLNRRAGLRGLAIPLAGASAVSLLAYPLVAWGAPAGAAAPVLASLLVADATSAMIPAPRWRWAALAIAAAAAALAIALPVLATNGGLRWTAAWAVAWWPLLLISLVPMVALVATRPVFDDHLASTEHPPATWMIAAACAPAVTALLLVTNASRDLVALYVAPIWLIVLVAWREVGRRISRARLQSDLVVAVTEAERAHLAAELHDVALQELTLLIWRLDASGDVDAAAMARSISERLRELCGELHLPILDELGTGPALEWLVAQVAAATSEEVRLERADPARPPSGVELAFFRVAQEAISNAVKHGGPPIVVRYMTSPSAATLFVDDAGLDRGLAWNLGRRSVVAPRPGHYGLLTMQQRAEQIGALLSIRSWPGEGTRVSLEWKAS
jgi:signal transduction histidine kinase